MPDLTAKLDAWFADNPNVVRDHTRDLVRIPSVNPKFEPDASPGGESRVQEYLADQLDKVGIAADTYEVSPGRTNLHTPLDPSAERTLAFNGHIDVVPAGDPAAWSKDPFGGQTEGDRLYGRGALDMKGGVAAALTAIRALREVGFDLDGRLALHTVVDEEAGGFGSRDLLERISAPGAVIVPEPSDEEAQIAEGGLEWVRVTILGRNGHSAWRYASIYPQPATDDNANASVNAIDLMADLIQAVRRLEAQWGATKNHPLLPPGFTTISSGVLRAGAESDEDGLPKLYENPAMVPDVACIDYDLKFFPGEEDTVRQEFEQFVHAWAQQYPWLRDNPPQITWELKGLWFPSMDTPPDAAIVQDLTGAASRAGHEVEISGFPAVADAAFYSHAGADAMIYGPKGGGLHGADEWVDIRSLARVARVLAGTAAAHLS